jgi:hypothetical protein
MTLILSGTDGLSDVDGSAATPAIRGTDTNTGIFFPAADTIAFSEGGAEVARFDSSGNLGIGTSSPAVKTNIVGSAGVTLRIEETSSGNATKGDFSANSTNVAIGAKSNSPLVFTTNDTERARIDTSGNVGIGTSSPTSSLTVSGTAQGTPTVNGVHLGITSNYAVIELCGSSSAGSLIDFTKSGTDYLGRILYNNTNNSLEFSTNNAERARIDSSGNLLVGLTTPGTVFSSTGSDRGGYIGKDTTSVAGIVADGRICLVLNRSTSTGVIQEQKYNGNVVGTISTNGSNTAYNTSSDYRLKHDIQPMTGGLSKIAQLKPVTYKWNADNSDGEGFIAHELAEVCPQAVSGEKDAVNEDGSIKPQGIDTSFLVATLTAAIQEQQALIQSLTARIAALEAKE